MAEEAGTASVTLVGRDPGTGTVTSPRGLFRCGLGVEARLTLRGRSNEFLAVARVASVRCSCASTAS